MQFEEIGNMSGKTLIPFFQKLYVRSDMWYSVYALSDKGQEAGNDLPDEPYHGNPDVPDRLKTVRNADQIFVIDKGTIVQQGTHCELMKQDGIYRRFVDSRKQAIGWKI